MSETAVETRDDFGRLPDVPADTPPEPAAESGGEPPAQEPPAPPEAAEPEPQAEQPWWAAYGATEEEAAERIRNIDHLRGRQANDIGELRQEIAKLGQRIQPEPAPQAQAPMIGELTVEQWESWYEDEPERATLYSQAAFSEATRTELRQELESQRANDRYAQETLERLRADLKDNVVYEQREFIGKLIGGLQTLAPGTLLDENGHPDYGMIRDLAEFASWRSQTGAQPRGTDGRFVSPTSPPVHVEGGSTPAPTSAAQSDDPDAALKAEIRGQSRRDNFGEVRPLAPEEG